MPKYKVTVRRIVREDTVVEVEAATPDAAREKAKDVASPYGDEWDCYDCEYWIDDGDVTEVVGG